MWRCWVPGAGTARIDVCMDAGACDGETGTCDVREAVVAVDDDTVEGVGVVLRDDGVVDECVRVARSSNVLIVFSWLFISSRLWFTSVTNVLVLRLPSCSVSMSN